MNGAGAPSVVTGSPTAPAGKASGKERRRKRTRWGPDAENNSKDEPRQAEAAKQPLSGEGSLPAPSAAGEAVQFPGPPPLPGQAGAQSTQQASIPALDDEKPRKRKRSRWQPEEEQTPIQLPQLAMVPGLPGMALPPSLIGLVDINPETMELHRRLNLVSSSFSIRT